MTVFKLKSCDRPSTDRRNCILFPTLPLELHEQIYRHALLPFSSPTNPHQVTVSTVDAIHGNDPRSPYFLPSICRVNEATRIDIGLWFIRNTEFGVLYPQHIVYFAQFLDTFPGTEGFDAIRRLDFQLFARYRPIDGHANAYIDFMARCPKLTQVRTKFEMSYLLKPESENRSVLTAAEFCNLASQTMDLERVVVLYGLVGLFELKGLARLTIELWPRIIAQTTRGLKCVVPDCWPVMEALVDWAKNGFGETGRTVDVRLVESGNSGLRWAAGIERGI